MTDFNYMTEEGYAKVQAELDKMKTQGRADAAKAIAEGREKGDLSENAEYHAAKDAQGLLEMKINQLEKQLANVKVVSPEDIDTSQVSVLTKVTIKNLKVNKEMTYQLVAEAEADVKAKKISVNSPIGTGLLGKKVGEIAEINTPAGLLKFEIMNITV